MTLTQRFSTKAMLAMASAALAAAAHADHGAPAVNYLGVHGGVNNLSGDWAADVSLGPGLSLPGAISTKRGSHFGVLGGRQTEHARFELEYQRGEFDITRLQLGPATQGVSTGGDYQAVTVNAYRTQPFGNRFTGYAGLGIGWGRVSLPNMSFTTPPCNCFPAASKSGFTWLARIGADFQLTDSGRAFLQYTHLQLPRAGSGGAPGVEYARKSVGAVTVGYRHTF